MKQKPGWRLVALASSLTFAMAASVTVGYLVGSFLDERLGGDGLLTALFILLGVLAGFYNLYRAAQKS